MSPGLDVHVHGVLAIIDARPVFMVPATEIVREAAKAEDPRCPKKRTASGCEVALRTPGNETSETRNPSRWRPAFA